ncbi:hypothetical protein AAFF_G00125780 [Aldrovandia affinis]|uniref:Uncharacterized protein n=1 Tax=Aldrovandia affinis TaxID=143900 RepID=A0AAD7RRD5_9TELE|nr:hypothetical protein AAFF_G00125780 [Aldrovandia affinis]
MTAVLVKKKAENLQEVFAAICQARLRLNPKKCQLFRREIAFLGHAICQARLPLNPKKCQLRRVSADPAKIAAVCDWPLLTNVSDLQSFLGLALYYRRYVQDFATITSPLHRLTDRGWPYIWDDPCSTAPNHPYHGPCAGVSWHQPPVHHRHRRQQCVLHRRAGVQPVLVVSVPGASSRVAVWNGWEMQV